MEHPNATWNDFSANIFQSDVSFQVSSNFSNNEKQTKAQLATLGKEMKNLRTELQEHRVKGVEGSSKPVDPNQKGRRNAIRLCIYCRSNGHTQSWWRKKIRDEELKKIKIERTAEQRVTFKQDYEEREDQAMGPDNGITIRILLAELIRIMDRLIRTVDDCLTDDQVNSPTETMKIDRLMKIIITKTELGELMAVFLVRQQDKKGTFLMVFLSAAVSLSKLGFRHFEDQMIVQPRVPLIMNKSFRKVTINHQRTWFASPPLLIALTNNQNSVR